ncbi:MAG: hypothetical protein ABXS91_08670 [Sulfurimonas sp.]
MQLPKQKLSKAELLKSPLVKEIEKYLKNLSFETVETNNHRVYRNPSSGKNAMLYNLALQGGTELTLWVSAKASVVRVEINNDVVESATASEEAAGITPREIAQEIIKKIHAEQTAEFKVKIDQRKINKLVNDLQDDETDSDEFSKLDALKKDLTKGSGKFVIINADGEFHAHGGSWTKTNTEIVVFDELEIAQEIAQDKYKVVRI